MFGRSKKPVEDGDEDRFKSMGDAIAALTSTMGQIAQQNAATQNLLRAIVLREPAQTGAPAPERVNGALPKLPVQTKLPNPVDDPDGFSSALLERVSAAANNVVAGSLTKHQQDQQMTEAQRAEQQAFWDGLDEEFAERFDDLKDQETAVSAAAKKVMARIKRRGHDIDKYVRADPDSWLEQVATEARTLIHVEKRSEDDDKQSAEADGDLGATTSPTHGDDPFRGMVLGDTGQKPVPSGKGKKDDGGSLMGDLMAEQRRMRLV